MAGANIFIMYTDASGSNVTIAPRLGLGEFQPNADTATKLTLLAGSGVSNGMMTANVKCMFWIVPRLRRSDKCCRLKLSVMVWRIDGLYFIICKLDLCIQVW